MKHEPIRIKVRDKHITQLKARGLNRLALSVRPFNLRPFSFTVNIDGLKPKLISKEQQIAWFEQLLKEPFEPWTFCISSEPNDRIAKATAAYVMDRVLNSAARYPLWHDIEGNFDNPVISDDFSKPSMLILSNVLPNSTAVKFEKLRDILVKHESIPRIIVTSGMDPFSFFAKHLYYPLAGCVYLKTSLVKGEVI